MADPPLDRIHIRALSLRCLIGVRPSERSNKQDVTVDITLMADLRRPCASDELGDTVDYSAVERDVVAAVEESSFFLIERLAEFVAEVCLAHPGVRGVRVAVEKPGASRRGRAVAAEIERQRPANR